MTAYQRAELLCSRIGRDAFEDFKIILRDALAENTNRCAAIADAMGCEAVANAIRQPGASWMTDLVERVARAIDPWDKRLADYCGENPIIERESAVECQKEHEAKRKARAAIAVVVGAAAQVVMKSKLFCDDERKLKHQLVAAIRALNPKEENHVDVGNSVAAADTTGASSRGPCDGGRLQTPRSRLTEVVLGEPNDGYPFVRAAFINAISEEGTKDDAVEWLQKEWNKACYWHQRASELEAKISQLEQERDEWRARANCYTGPPDQ